MLPIHMYMHPYFFIYFLLYIKNNIQYTIKKNGKMTQDTLYKLTTTMM